MWPLDNLRHCRLNLFDVAVAGMVAQPPSDIFAFEISDIEVAAYSDKEWQMQ